MSIFKTRTSDNQQKLKPSEKRNHNLGKDICIWLKSNMHSMWIIPSNQVEKGKK